MIDTQELKINNKIIDVAENLGMNPKSTGGTTAVSCFEHIDKHPSLVLQPDTNTFKCMSCGIKGDVIDLVKGRLGTDFAGAVHYLGGNDEVESKPVVETPQQYLDRKKITKETIDKFDIKIVGNEIHFPIPTGIKKRLFGVDKKYSHTLGTSGCVFKTADLGDKKTVVLTEGEFDAIKLWQETGAVAWSATTGAQAFKDEYVDQFKDVRTIYIAYDNDKAGLEGREDVANRLGKDRCYFIDLPTGKDICDYFELGGTASELISLIKNAKPANHNPYLNTQLTFSQIMSLPERGNIYLVDELIPKGCTIISAPPKSMKSFIMLHLLSCFVDQKPLFGHFGIQEPQRILLLDRENSPHMLQKRSKMLSIIDNDLLFYNNDRRSLRDKMVKDQLIDYIDYVKPGVIVMDSLIRFIDGNENSSDDVSKFFKIVDEIKDKGISVIIIHHNNKNPEAKGSNKMRGSTDFSAYPDASIQIKKIKTEKGTRLKITQTDNRHDQEIDKFGVEVITTDDSMNMIYVSSEDMKDQKLNEAKSKIMEYFFVGQNLTRKIMESDKRFNGIARDVLDSALFSMYSLGVIDRTKGSHGAHVYNLINRE